MTRPGSNPRLDQATALARDGLELMLGIVRQMVADVGPEWATKSLIDLFGDRTQWPNREAVEALAACALVRVVTGEREPSFIPELPPDHDNGYGRRPPPVRPDPPYPAPAGAHWEVNPDVGWRIGAGGRRCRQGAAQHRPACGAVAVAVLLRTRYGNDGPSLVEWAYCADHMYGRWVEDGRVVGWVLRDDAGGGAG